MVPSGFLIFLTIVQRKGGRPRGKRKPADYYDDNFLFEVVQDNLGVQDSGEESEKEKERELEAERAKRKLYKKQLEKVS